MGIRGGPGIPTECPAHPHNGLKAYCATCLVAGRNTTTLRKRRLEALSQERRAVRARKAERAKRGAERRKHPKLAIGRKLRRPRLTKLQREHDKRFDGKLFSIKSPLEKLQRYGN